MRFRAVIEVHCSTSRDGVLTWRETAFIDKAWFCRGYTASFFVSSTRSVGLTL